MIFSQSDNSLIILSVCKRISLLASSDQGLCPLDTRKPFGKKA